MSGRWVPFAFLILLAACTSGGVVTIASPPTVTVTTTPRVTPRTVPPGVAAWPAPNQRLTPGAVVTCTMPRPQSERVVPQSEKDAVAAAYGYTGRRGLRYVEFDHRVPFALCGANDARNIWPEPADGIAQTGFVHNRKDQLEAAVIRAVYAHRLTLAQGQAVFYDDWRKAWCVWVRTPGVHC
jgi:hypothetical protein